MFILVFDCRYARKHFSCGDEQFMQNIQRAMGLLAYSPATKCKRYQVSYFCSSANTLTLYLLSRNFSPSLDGMSWSFYSVRRTLISFSWVFILFSPVSCRQASLLSKHRILWMLYFSLKRTFLVEAIFEIISGVYYWECLNPSYCLIINYTSLTACHQTVLQDGGVQLSVPCLLQVV